MDTAGKAVVLSGITVLVSLSAVLLVPAPAVRTMAVGIMLAVTFVLAATLTLLPATLGALGRRSMPPRCRMPNASSTAHRCSLAGATLLHNHPWPFALGSLAILIALAIPVIGLKVAMPSIAVVPEDAPVRQGYELVQQQMGEGAPGMLQIIVPAAERRQAADGRGETPGIDMVTPAQPAPDGTDYVMLQALPSVDPSDAQMATIVSDLRGALPADALVGGAPAENLDLQQALNDYLPLIIGVILVLGFVLLLVALQAPLIAVIGTVVSLLSTAAAFGVAKLIFQDGHLSGPARLHPAGLPRRLGTGVLLRDDLRHRHGLHRLPARHRQGALSSGPATPTTAQIDGMAHSGRIIFAAAAVMVAVFFTFASRRSVCRPRKWASSSVSRCCSTPS